MILSHKHRFVILLPWKTASQTISHRLSHLNESPYNPFFHFNPYLNRVVHQHLTLADFLSLPEAKLDYFRTVFVRNPYDRVYSGFKQLRKDIQDQPKQVFQEPWVRSLVVDQLADNLSQLQNADFEFNKWLDTVKDYQVYESGNNTNFPLHPCHYWTHIKGKPHVDFIGKVENFEDDFSQLKQRLNVSSVSNANTNVTDLVGSSQANLFGYRYVDRMTGASIEKINRLFARDFELFSYQMIRP